MDAAADIRCPSCGEQNPGRARFCLACATPLAESQLPDESRKVVTFLFVDIVRSSELAQRLDAEPYRQLMSRYFAEMNGILRRHGGTAEKFIGDAVVGVFGIPRLHEDDAVRAARAAVEMRDLIKGLAPEFQQAYGTTIDIRVGINCGEVVVAQGEDALLAGQPAILASRLQEAANPGEVLMSEPVYRMARAVVEAEALDPLLVKGSDRTVAAYRLIELRAHPEGTAMSPAPLVGRSEELRELTAAFEAARTKVAQAITVLGWPGIGKSRLVKEFVSQIDPSTIALRGRCLSYGEGITFWAVQELVGSLSGIEPDDDAATALAKLEQIVSGRDDAAIIAHHVGQMMGLTDTGAPVQQSFWALREFLCTGSGGRPVVLILEDVHWAETTFVELIQYLARGIGDSPLMLICTARPELLDLHPQWMSDIPGAKTILLQPLAQDAAAVLVRELLQGLDVPNVAERIAAASEGNPLFVEQLISHLRDQQLLEVSNGGWRFVGEAKQLTIPPTINALIGARLDNLSRHERSVIQRASVVGKEFSEQAVRSVCSGSLAEQLHNHLTGLSRKGLVRRGSGEEWRFQHALVRETAYQSMPKTARAELHEQVGDWMERQAADRIAQYEEIIGYHFEEACRYTSEVAPSARRHTGLAERAARRLAPAGRRALARDDIPTAINLLERATSLAPESSDEALEILPDLAEALREAGEFVKARRVLADAVGRARKLGATRIEARAALVEIDLLFRTDPGQQTIEGRAELERLVPVFEEVQDDLGLAKAWNLLAHLLWWRGQFVAMENASMNAVEYARRAGDAREEAWAWTGLAIATAMGPKRVDLALARCEEILQRLEGNRLLEARTLLPIALLRAWEGDIEASRSCLRRARAIHEDLGLRLRAQTELPQLAGTVELLAGDPVAAERELRAGQQAGSSMGERTYVSVVAVRLAQAVYAQGRYDEADSLSTLADEEATTDSVFIQVWRQTVRAKVLARKGENSAAKDLADGALELALTTQHVSLQADTFLDKAEVMALLGDVEEASVNVARALELYRQKGHLVGVKRAQQLAQEIEPSRRTN